MLDIAYDILPFPYDHLAHPCPLDPLNTPGFLHDLFKTGGALAGVLAAAARDPEVDAEDFRLSLRLLAAHLHSVEALWCQWRAHEELDEAAEAPPTTRAPDSPRTRRGTVRDGTPGCVG